MAFVRAATSRISNQLRLGIAGPMQTSMRCCAASKHYTSVEEIQAQLQSIIDAKPELYGEIAGKGIDYNAFSDLVAEALPNVGPLERRSLFTSMDVSGDGWIQDDELFADVVMRVLRSRSEAEKELHPVQGSFASLPRPPFVKDAKQMMSVLELSKVYDAVMKDFERKQAAAPKIMRKKIKKKEMSTIDTLASLFGAKKAPKRRKKQRKVKQETPKGLYMVGSDGSGKTSILNVFFRSFPENFPVVRLHWHEFCRDALAYMESASKQKQQGTDMYASIADEIVKRCQVLLLDEVNIATISEGILVKELFRQLWKRGVTIVATSNHKIDDLYEGGHNRGTVAEFFPEFKENCPETNMSSDVDYRTVGVSASGNFLVGKESIEENNKKFEAATHGYEKDLELAIPNQKRTIYTRAADLETGVARYTFDDLCGKPIGRTEYAIIAKTFHTIFVDNIPKLSSSGADAIKIRRFVSLIDIMYDKKVNLHTLSQVACQDIFTPTDDISADDRNGWKRTQSMLTEMESTKYASMAWLVRQHLVMDKATRL